MKTKWVDCNQCGEDWIVSERTNEADYKCPACRKSPRDLLRPLLRRKAAS